MSLHFGTAGLRAEVGPGEDQMNIPNITRATAGVGAWLIEQAEKKGQTVDTIRVVVGCDARYGSSTFARATAEVFAALDIDVTLLNEPAPTPVVAWVVRSQNYTAGVQITASHNPALDNGYKLYLTGGSQLISPADTEIEALIAKQPEAQDIPRQTDITQDFTVLKSYVRAISDIVEAAKNLDEKTLENRKALRIAYTPMHGVGGNTMEAAFKKTGFETFTPVPAQRWPDPNFPSVAFPNPEEKGATDLLLAQGKDFDADILIALDPDADRCALGIKDEHGQFTMLRGDQTGPLLASYVLGGGTKAYTPSTSGPAPVVATTIVSSELLKAMAQKEGWDFQETLTGFKFLSKAAEGHEGDLVFAYEEALGTCVAPDTVADKDGISTALVAASWAAQLKAEGGGLAEQLAALEKKYGTFQTIQRAQRYDSVEDAAQVIDRFIATPPELLAGISVHAEPLDGTVGVRLRGQSDTVSLRVVARPSGTEPKAKFYLETYGDDPQEVEATLSTLQKDIEQYI